MEVVVVLLVSFFTLYGMLHFGTCVADFFCDHKWHW